MATSAGGAYIPSDASAASPTITGTVTGGASYTAPTLTSPAISGTVTGGASYTAPTLTSPVLSGATTASGTIVNDNTLTAAAYAASTHEDELYSKITLTPATTVTAANGLNAFRGEVNITAGKTLGSGAASYVTAVYGRVNFNTATVNIASGDLAAVFAKFDMGSTSTLTSGHIAPLQSNIVNPPATAEATTDLIYAESASGTRIKSVLSGYAAAAYGFDLTDVGATWLSTTGTCTTPGQAHGWIKVLINGAARYIALSEAVS